MASSNEGCHYGKYRGTVTDNRDPQGRGRLRAKVELLGDVTCPWALPCAMYAGEKTGAFLVPAVGAGVWIEFEAGDVSRPIWTGCWWSSNKVPTDHEGTMATADVRIVRSEEGLMLALHDDTKVIALSDENGANILEIQVQGGQITIKAKTRVVVDAPAIELVAGATHPGVFGDDLSKYLGQFVTAFNTHMHAGQMAGPLPVAPTPPACPFTPPTPDMLSTVVKLG